MTMESREVDRRLSLMFRGGITFSLTVEASLRLEGVEPTWPKADTLSTDIMLLSSQKHVFMKSDLLLMTFFLRSMFQKDFPFIG